MSLSFWTPEVQRRKKLKSTIKKLEHKNNSPILCAYVPEVWESNPFQLSEGLDQERQVKRFSQFWSPQECVIFSALRPEDVSYCKSTKLSVFSYTDISYMDSNIGYIYTAIVIKRKKGFSSIDWSSTNNDIFAQRILRQILFAFSHFTSKKSNFSPCLT